MGFRFTIRPYVGWFCIANPSTSVQHQTRGSFGSGIYATSSQYRGPATITPYTGEGAGTPFVSGNAFGGGGGYQNPNSGLGELTTYTYPASGADRPHAVTSLTDKNGATVGTFTYDANGNMITRVQNGVSWIHTFDAENRLTTVSGNGTTTTYVYDGMGYRVQRIVQQGSTTTKTVYVAGMEIEYSGTTETKRTVYYGMGGAFRIIGGSNAGVFYRHRDHLGSTSLISNSSGQKVTNSEIVYAPFGEIRSGELTTLTDFNFTGQRLDRSTGGLMFYRSRYYLPALRRFISPDSIVPGAANSQAFSRYSYSYNNPITYSDPSGHAPEPYTDEWWVARYYVLQLWKYEDPGVNDLGNAMIEACVTEDPTSLIEVLGNYGVSVTEQGVQTRNVDILIQVAISVAFVAHGIENIVRQQSGNSGEIDAASLFKQVMGSSTTINVVDEQTLDNMRNKESEYKLQNCFVPEISISHVIY